MKKEETKKLMTKDDWMYKVLELKLEITKANQALDDLKTYLLSEKFHNDTSVQVSDVLRRLEAVALPHYPQLSKGAFLKP